MYDGKKVSGTSSLESFSQVSLWGRDTMKH